jgi:hypothetical protein
MPLNPWELSYNGLVFGADLQIGVLSITGLEPPEAKADVRPKVAADGSFTFAAFYAERHVIINGDIIPTSGSPNDLEALINSWRTAFDNQGTDLDLDYRLGTGSDRRIKCKPTRRTINVDRDYNIGAALWIVELVAGDPAIYNTSNTKLFDG